MTSSMIKAYADLNEDTNDELDYLMQTFHRSNRLHHIRRMQSLKITRI